MFCPKCGQAVAEGAYFCPKCGSNVGAGTNPGFSPTVPVPADQQKTSGLAIAGLVLGYMVVALMPIMLIIAAIAIPNLLRARMAANEASAVGSIRTLATAEGSYAMEHPDKGYTCSVADLKDLIPPELASGSKSGYVFELLSCSAETPESANAKFQVIAYPIKKGASGIRAFCSDESIVIRYDRSGSGQSCLENGTVLGK